MRASCNRGYGGRKDLEIVRTDLKGNYESSKCMFMTLRAACIRDAELYIDEVVDSFGLGKYQKMFDLMEYGVDFEKIQSPDWLTNFEEFWDQV